MLKQYKVKIIVAHIEKVWADNKEEAREQAEAKVFVEKVNVVNGDLIIGYQAKLIRKGARHA